MSDSPGRGMRVLIAVPAFNEEQSVSAVVHGLRSLHPDHDVLVIDDGSTDSTAKVARLAGAKVCRLPFNLGVGGAMRTAYKFARDSDYDAVVQVDADGQHDPRFVRELLSGLASADVVVGARFAGVGDYRVARPKRLAMGVLARLLSRQAGVRLTDVTSGFRAANRRAIHLFAAHYPTEYLGDTVEALVIAARSGYRIVQVPVEMKDREHGRSSQSTLFALAYLTRASAALVMAMVRSWPMPDQDRAVGLANRELA